MEVNDAADQSPDPLLADAIELIGEFDRVSASLLQRRLNLSYERASTLTDQLEARGYIGQFDGSVARQVLHRAADAVRPPGDAGPPTQQRQEIARQAREISAQRARHASSKVIDQSKTTAVHQSRSWRLPIIGALIIIGGLYAVGYWSLSPTRSPSTDNSRSLSACEAAFEDALDGSVEATVEYDLDPALAACTSLAEWSAAWRRFPPPAGNDPSFVAENRCLTGKFNGAAICRELGIP